MRRAVVGRPRVEEDSRRSVVGKLRVEEEDRRQSEAERKELVYPRSRKVVAHKGEEDPYFQNSAARCFIG